MRVAWGRTEAASDLKRALDGVKRHKCTFAGHTPIPAITRQNPGHCGRLENRGRSQSILMLRAPTVRYVVGDRLVTTRRLTHAEPLERQAHPISRFRVDVDDTIWPPSLALEISRRDGKSD